MLRMARTAGVCLALATALGALAAEPLELKLRFRKDDAYSFRKIGRQRMTIHSSKGPWRTSLVLGVGVTCRIQEVAADGSAWVAVTFEWIRHDSTGSTGRVLYDSATSKAKAPVRDIPSTLTLSSLVPRNRSLPRCWPSG